MNLIIFCATSIFCFPTSLAFQVSFHEVDLIKLKYEADPSLVCTQHRFMYQRGDNFTMYIKLRNYTSAVTKANVVIKRPGFKNDSSSEFLLVDKKVILQLMTEKITIDVELFTKDGCLRETILEGRVSADAADTGYRYNDICLNENRCAAVVNAAQTCTHMKPQPCEVTGSDISYFTVTIILSITAAVTLISLIVISIRHFYKKKYNPSGLSDILPVNENPYYENIHCRDGCQQQKEKLEQPRPEVFESPEPIYANLQPQ